MLYTISPRRRGTSWQVQLYEEDWLGDGSTRSVIAEKQAVIRFRANEGQVNVPEKGVQYHYVEVFDLEEVEPKMRPGFLRGATMVATRASRSCLLLVHRCSRSV